MYGLTLEWPLCPDGLELVEYDDPPPDARQSATLLSSVGRLHHRVFRYLSDQRRTAHHDLNDLLDPIVIHFVNSRNDTARLRFFHRFGLPHARPPGGKPPIEIETDAVAQLQESFGAILAQAGSGDPKTAIDGVNFVLDQNNVASLTPSLDLAGGNGSPRLALRPRSLVGFMTMECAMVAANDARLAQCEHCEAAFLTGPLTGRRSHARFCSDRCRVAAMRKRKAANS